MSVKDDAFAPPTPQIESKGPHSRRLKLVTVIATFGGLLFGYDTCHQRALPYMKNDLGLSPFTEGLVTSSLLFGAALGPSSVPLSMPEAGARTS